METIFAIEILNNGTPEIIVIDSKGILDRVIPTENNSTLFNKGQQNIDEWTMNISVSVKSNKSGDKFDTAFIKVAVCENTEKTQTAAEYFANSFVGNECEYFYNDLMEMYIRQLPNIVKNSSEIEKISDEFFTKNKNKRLN